MINDNSLGDRLNAVKNGKPIPQPPVPQLQPMLTQQAPTVQEQKPTPSIKQQIYARLISMTDSFLASLLYGYAIKTILSLDWSVFAAFTVGFLFNHAISVFPKVLFPKLFK